MVMIRSEIIGVILNHTYGFRPNNNIHEKISAY